MFLFETMVIANETVGQVDPYFALALAKDVYIYSDLILALFYVCVGTIRCIHEDMHDTLCYIQ